MISFSIGGITIPVEAGNGTIEQTYEDVSRSTTHEMGDGSLIKQTYVGAGKKLRTTISGSEAWVPPCFGGLDFDAPQLLKCSTPRAIHGAGRIITVPAARRSDAGYTPKGYAIKNDVVIETGVESIVGDTVTLDTVTGAEGYVVHYWPEITVYATFTETGDQASAHYGWQLVCREK
ncbi:MAG: hypothetical protein ABW066_06795 [Sedimenticola sp.]